MLDCIHVCVFHISKNWFQKLARHLLDTLLSVDLFQLFYCIPDSFTIPGGWIEKVPASSIAFQHLVDHRASVLGSDELFLDTCSIPQLSTTFSSIAISIPLHTYIYRALLRIYIFVLRDPILISSIFLDLSTPVYLPNTISFTPNLFLCDFSSFFKIFFSW